MRIRPVALLLAMLGCSPAPEPTPPPAPPAPPRPTPAASASAEPEKKPAPTKPDRGTFNRSAMRSNLPLYWVADANKNGEPDPDEVVGLQFFATVGKWTKDGAFTPAYHQALKEMGTPEPDPADPKEAERRKLVVGEMDAASPSLVFSDFRKASAEDRAFVRRMMEVAAQIDLLYATQTGASALVDKVADDAPSQSLFRRNWGPRCLTPGFDKNPACSAVEGAPKPVVDVYPPDLQQDPKFCEAIEKHKDAKKLLEPFTVVRKDGKGELKAVPYSEAYRERVTAIAAALRAAASELKSPKEKPLVTYLEAAAKSFASNDWLPADEAWAKMNAQNSAWYVRVGPDETYWEPCSHKAGFHLTFARINPDSLRWQEKLKPVQQQMEDDMAALIGAPYKARKVTFHLPDFIDIVANAGDDRNALGATIGQSLPNWGPVSAQGRGRTVAMSNLYTDPDSLAVRRAKVEALMSKPTAEIYADLAEPGLVATILHEAAHNLGPANEYKVQGKKAEQAFGGDLASMLEELKAQSASLWYVGFVEKKGIIDANLARRVYVDSMIWAMNHISRGMWTATRQRKHYSQLAAIQVGFLLDEKALVFDPDAVAANGTDKGAYTLDFSKLPAALDKLMKEVGRIKATNDKAAAEALSARYVDGIADHHKRISERCLRFPQPTFVYAVEN